MPLGSSSAAPVTSPGPSALQIRFRSEFGGFRIFDTPLLNNNEGRASASWTTYCFAQAPIAAVETAPPITQGSPNSTWPAAAAAMQPSPIAA
jgi:hypothetical protein